MLHFNTIHFLFNKDEVAESADLVENSVFTIESYDSC